MDPLSQAVVGALLPQAFAPPQELRKATLLGALGGMAADLDILIRSNQDALLQIEYHRHFSHSLAFIPVGGLLVGLACWPWMRNRLRLRRILTWATLGYATGGLLDACTSYGTRLLWPFSQSRIAWDLVSVIDPLFTATTLTLAAIAFGRRSPKVARFGWVFIFLYLTLAFVQQQRAEVMATDLAKDRGDTIKRVVLKPSFGNIFLWRSVYETEDGHIQADALRPGIFAEGRRYRGERCPIVTLEDIGKNLPADCRQHRDMVRFAHFSGNWLGMHPTDKNVVGDMRYATMPDRIKPLWGIEIDSSRPDEHVAWRTYRSVDKSKLERLWNMILGRPLP